MTLLALDCAAAACSAALWRDGAVAGHRFERMARGHAEALMPMILGVLERAETSFADITRLAVTVGPGSFTGLRVGLATARGLALARRLPLEAVTTFEAVAHAAAQAAPPGEPARDLLIVLDTRRTDLYVQRFSADLTPHGAPAVLPPAEIGPMLASRRWRAAGDGVARLREQLRPCGADVVFDSGSGLPDAASVAAVAAGRCAAKFGDPPPSPLYVQPPLATVPPGGGRLRP